MFKKIKDFFFRSKKNKVEYKETEPVIKKESQHWAAIEKRKFEKTNKD